jgi:hypothetical protein
MGWLRYLLERWRARGLPSGHYELRFAYDPATTLGQADVHSRHDHIDDAAAAFVHCGAPLKQILWVEHGEPDWLDDLEEARLKHICAAHGYDVDERDYGT